jgi:hypothetical protein
MQENNVSVTIARNGNYKRSEINELQLSMRKIRAKAWLHALRENVNEKLGEDLTLYQIGKKAGKHNQRGPIRIDTPIDEIQWITREARISVENAFGEEINGEWSYLFGPDDSFLFDALCLSLPEPDDEIKTQIEKYCELNLGTPFYKTSLTGLNNAIWNFKNLIGGKIEDIVKLNTEQLLHFIELYPMHSIKTLAFAINVYQLERLISTFDDFVPSLDKVCNLLDDEVVIHNLGRFQINPKEIHDLLLFRGGTYYQPTEEEEKQSPTIYVDMEMLGGKIMKREIYYYLRDL